MTANIDNTSDALPGVIRDVSTGVTWGINADGSPKITHAGVTDAAGSGASIDNKKTALPGSIRDAFTGTPLKVNADGSINVAF